MQKHIADITSHLVLIGGGGHALVVAEAAQLSGHVIDGFVDDAPQTLLGTMMGLKRLGALEALATLPHARILAIGDIAVRTRTALRYSSQAWCNVLHPAAVVSLTAKLGTGVLIGAGAIVQAFARVGDHAIVNTGAIVEHECVIGAHCHIAPRVVMGGNVSIGTGTLVGIGATVLPGVTIGSGAVIGGGAVVTSDVPNDSVVIGVPGRTR